VSGKKKIAKFEGGYHGGTNEVLANFKYNKEKGGAVERPNTVPASIGVPPEHLAHTIVLPYNHEAAFDIIEQNKNELALILVEVIQGMGGNIIGKHAFIQKLRKITRELGILLIVDEVITGFRVGLGGGQVMYDIDADLSTYGKIMGGGTPSAAVGGRAAIMDAIAYTGNPDVDGKEKPFWGGTLNGNPLSMVAGAATLEYLTAHPEIYPEMERLGRKLREKVNEFCRKEGFPVQMTGTSSMFCTHFVEGPIESVRDLVNANTAAIPLFYTHLINEGVFIPNNHMGFISAAHTEADVDKMIGAHCRALQKVREMGAV
jgi:glutamate-1-semialdehyde 2,1-aminomutase